MKIEPYLFFNGSCAEAIAYYQSALGAVVEMQMRFRESPDIVAMRLPAGWEDKIMHASLRIGDTTLMASDGMSAAKVGFVGVSLSISLTDEAAARRIFDALADGGEIRMPLGKTFWSPCYGMVMDRFGVGWMLNVDR